MSPEKLATEYINLTLQNLVRPKPEYQPDNEDSRHSYAFQEYIQSKTKLLASTGISKYFAAAILNKDYTEYGVTYADPLPVSLEVLVNLGIDLSRKRYGIFAGDDDLNLAIESRWFTKVQPLFDPSLCPLPINIDEWKDDLVDRLTDAYWSSKISRN